MNQGDIVNCIADEFELKQHVAGTHLACIPCKYNGMLTGVSKAMTKGAFVSSIADEFVSKQNVADQIITSFAYIASKGVRSNGKSTWASKAMTDGDIGASIAYVRVRAQAERSRRDSLRVQAGRCNDPTAIGERPKPSSEQGGATTYRDKFRVE